MALRELTDAVLDHHRDRARDSASTCYHFLPKDGNGMLTAGPQTMCPSMWWSEIHQSSVAKLLPMHYRLHIMLVLHAGSSIKLPNVFVGPSNDSQD